MTRAAKRRRAAGETNVYAPDELKKQRFHPKEIVKIISRPFIMFATEPIVLCLSLLSGFSDALIFTFLEAFGPVFKQWNFGTIDQGLAFIPIGIGYLIAYLSFLPFVRRNERVLAKDPDGVPPEQRLYWLLFSESIPAVVSRSELSICDCPSAAPLLSIGLFGFAWTSLGPPIPWIAPLLFTALVGIANYSIYMATIDYMINSYGPYSASAAGGNGFARDFLAGIAAFYATPRKFLTRIIGEECPPD